MPKRPIKSVPGNIPTDVHPNLQEEIRRHAFEIYVEHGREDGHDLDDWLEAESEITAAAVKRAA